MELLNYDEYFLTFGENAEILTEGVIDSIKNSINNIINLFKKMIEFVKKALSEFYKRIKSLSAKDKQLINKAKEAEKQMKSNQQSASTESNNDPIIRWCETNSIAAANLYNDYHGKEDYKKFINKGNFSSQEIYDYYANWRSVKGANNFEEALNKLYFAKGYHDISLSKMGGVKTIEDTFMYITIAISKWEKDGGPNSRMYSMIDDEISHLQKWCDDIIDNSNKTKHLDVMQYQTANTMLDCAKQFGNMYKDYVRYMIKNFTEEYKMCRAALIKVIGSANNPLNIPD